MSFIDAHDFPAGLVLRVLDIATSTYYDWRARRVSPSRRELDDAALLEQILKVRSVNQFATTYGAPRVWLELRRQGVRVGRKRVERIMRTYGLQGAYLRRGWRHGSTRQNPNHTAAPDLVDRDFRVDAPNRLWVADLTRLVTGEGVLWLASVRDAFANRIVGWATDPRATTTLVLTALNHALRTRDVRAGQLIHHSDKGAQGSTPRCGSPSASSTPASPPRLAVPVQLRQRPGREPLVDDQGRADLLARHHIHHPRPGRTRPIPLHRRLVQPAPDPGRPPRAVPRRVRGDLPSRPARPRQVKTTPAKRGKLTGPPQF